MTWAIINTPEKFIENGIANQCILIDDGKTSYWKQDYLKYKTYKNEVDSVKKEREKSLSENNYYALEDNLGIAKLFKFNNDNNVYEWLDEDPPQNGKVLVKVKYLFLINTSKDSIFPSKSEKTEFELVYISPYNPPYSMTKTSPYDSENNLYEFSRVNKGIKFIKNGKSKVKIEKSTNSVGTDDHFGNKCATYDISGKSLVNINSDSDPDPPNFYVKDNTLYSEDNESVKGSHLNETCFIKYYTLLPADKINDEMSVYYNITTGPFYKENYKGNGKPVVSDLVINSDKSILNSKSFEDDGWINNMLTTIYCNNNNCQQKDVFRLVYVWGYYHINQSSENNWYDKKILKTNVFINKSRKKICVSENNPGDINWDNCENIEPPPPNSNNSKDEVNLPLVIGVSVGGFVLLAVIVYYFMGKGRGRGRSKGKKSSAKSNNASNKKGGSRKAGRGKSK